MLDGDIVVSTQWRMMIENRRATETWVSAHGMPRSRQHYEFESTMASPQKVHATRRPTLKKKKMQHDNHFDHLNPNPWLACLWLPCPRTGMSTRR